MDINQLTWNGFEDDKLQGEYVSFEIKGLTMDGNYIVAVDIEAATNGLCVYGRKANGEAVALHDSQNLDECRARVMLLQSLTPSSRWAANGESDPHGEEYDCARSELALGHYTDDELANAVFLHNHHELDLQVDSPGAPSSIDLLTAAKERIRWLSRQLTKAAVPYNELYWSERSDGRLPEGQKWKDFTITGFLDGKEVPVQQAETYRIDGVTSTVTYHLHTTRSYGAALSRLLSLEVLCSKANSI